MRKIAIVGFGAIGQGIISRVKDHPELNISYVVSRTPTLEQRVELTERGIQMVTDVPPDTTLLVECAGHAAVSEHVMPALRRGIECAVLSIGAMATGDNLQQLEAAARSGRTSCTLLTGAVGGIDAVQAAKFLGIDELTYICTKPPAAWMGTAAEEVVDLKAVKTRTMIFEGNTAGAAEKFPKNANVAATVGIAGLGLTKTRATYFVDPSVAMNSHELSARGEFGSLTIRIDAAPSSLNPKTSALTIASALRFLTSRAAAVRFG